MSRVATVKRRIAVEAVCEPSPLLEAGCALLFNLGLALTIGVGLWHLAAGPSMSVSSHWWKLCLGAAGLAVAGPAWIAGSGLSSARKQILSVAFVAVVLGLAAAQQVEFDAEDSVLQPWRIDGGRLVHDALGISIATPAGWQFRVQPAVVKSRTSSERPRQRLWPGEAAVFLQMADLRQETSGQKVVGSIQLAGGAYGTRSFPVALAIMHTLESIFSAQPGMKLVAPTLRKEVNGLDTLVCGFRNAQGNDLHVTLFRSGSYYVHVVTQSADDKDARQIKEFLNSISVAGHATDLDD